MYYVYICVGPNTVPPLFDVLYCIGPDDWRQGARAPPTGALRLDAVHGAVRPGGERASSRRGGIAGEYWYRVAGGHAPARCWTRRAESISLGRTWCWLNIRGVVVLLCFA